MAEPQVFDLDELITEEGITDVLSVGATVTVIEEAAGNLDDCRFADEEIAVIRRFPDDLRAKLTYRLAELAEMARDAVQELEGRVLQLRGIDG